MIQWFVNNWEVTLKFALQFIKIDGKIDIKNPNLIWKHVWIMLKLFLLNQS